MQRNNKSNVCKRRKCSENQQLQEYVHWCSISVLKHVPVQLSVATTSSATPAARTSPVTSSASEQCLISSRTLAYRPASQFNVGHFRGLAPHRPLPPEALQLRNVRTTTLHGLPTRTWPTNAALPSATARRRESSAACGSCRYDGTIWTWISAVHESLPESNVFQRRRAQATA